MIVVGASRPMRDETYRSLADDTLAVILAGGNGTRLEPLTRRICKPALPFGGGFRSIDFSLSNCLNSGIRIVGVPTQYKPQALLQHLGDAWSDAAGAGACIVTPWRAEVRAPRLGYRGTADAVYRNLTLIEKLDRRLVLVLAGDHVYKMDYRPMLERHRVSGAGVTIGCIEVPVEEARHFGIAVLGDADRVERFVEKPRTRAELPGEASEKVLASMGIYVFDTDYLARLLRADAFAAESRHDFGGDILPRIVRDGAAFAYPVRDSADSDTPYWRDIGTLGAYWRSHMELVGPSPQLRLDSARWPLVTRAGVPLTVTSRVATTERGTVEDALIAPHIVIAGHVRRSVVFRGAEIGRDSAIADAVILPGAKIGAGCRLRGVIVDSDCVVPAGTIAERVPATSGPFEPLVLANDDSGAYGNQVGDVA
jgi:glucose-1-phosphate adenylyltransferase